MNGVFLPAMALWSTVSLYGLGAVLPLVMQTARRASIVAGICAALGSLAALLAGVSVLSGAGIPALTFDTNLPLGALSVRLDDLSAFFLAVIGLVSLPIAIYTIGYLKTSQGRRTLVLSALFNLLLLSLVVIVTANDLVLFLVGWEAMAFLSYIVVNAQYEDRSTIRASYLMLAVSELGTIGILLAFLLLAQTAGGFGFAAIRASAPLLSLTQRTLIFLLAFFGFGAKIGVLPLQLWMPTAYRAAPDHISALLSAVLINLGIYGLMRVLLDFLAGTGPLPAWWGLFVLSIGAVTALIGILYAVVQRDLKQVLAYSSVENMGLILASLGAALTFRAYHLPILAAIAAIVTLYHLLNHAVYKGLLFLGTGSIVRATGSSALEKLGGLVRLMPWTSVFFLVAALSIAAVPPFNGYISEWMLLETLLQSFALPDTLAKVVIAIDGGMLALTAGIAVTAFVRAYAVSFLALPHTQEAAHARETSPLMSGAMGYLALLCLLLGILPTFVLPIIDRVTTPLLGLSVLNQVVPPVFTPQPGEYAPLVGLGGTLFQGLPTNGLIVIAAPHFSTIDAPTYLFLAEILLFALVALGVHLLRPLGARRVGPVWAGGIPHFTETMTYTELAYSNPLRLVFQRLYRSRSQMTAEEAASTHGSGRITYEQEIPPPFERELYQPAARITRWVSSHVQWIQSGNINQYIAYIFLLVLVILLLRVL